MKFANNALAAVALAASIMAVGCGGGTSTSSNNNNGSNSQSTPGQAQGVYSGTASDGGAFQSIILPNDTYYAIYGTTTGNVFAISGMMTGQGASKSGNFTASVTDFNNAGSINTGSVTANYVVGSSINGTVVEGSNPAVTFSGTVMPSSSFNYNTAASLSNINGTWSGTLLDGSTASVTINADGSFSGTDSSGCQFSGTLTPDSSGKNFFEVSLTFGASPCLLPNQSASGIAVNYLLSDGVTTQFLAGVASGTSFGTVFVANN